MTTPLASLAGNESARRRWSRRAVTIPAVFLGAACGVLALPVLWLVAGASDLLRRRPWPHVRGVSIAVYYLVFECLGLVASAALWLASPLATGDRWLAWNSLLQAAWARGLFAGLRWIFGLRVDVDADAGLVSDVPLIVLVRHTSIADTVLAASFLSWERGVRLRYVLKRALLYDPCLDVVGQRIPNAFVLRDGSDSAAQRELLRRLADGIGPGEGVLIYPEGTRFTPEKRRRALARLAAAGDAAITARAEQLRSVLPPRLGGVLTLLDAMPGADVLIVSHVGFDAIARAADVFNGALIGRRLCVRLSKHAAADVPTGGEARVSWLFDRWEEMDRWVNSNQESGANAPPATA